jgi:hypothetical protein
VRDAGRLAVGEQALQQILQLASLGRREPVEELAVIAGDDFRDPGIQRAALGSQFNVDLAPVANFAHRHTMAVASSRSSRRDIGPASIPANWQERDEGQRQHGHQSGGKCSGAPCWCCRL